MITCKFFRAEGEIRSKVRLVNGGLETDPRWDVYVENEFLNGLFDTFVTQFVIPDKGGEECVKVGYGLGTGSFSL